MDNPRAEKVAVVDEVRQRLGDASATVVTEYRGLTVAELAELRRSLAAAGGDYKVYKNTLVKLAVGGSEHESISELLSGPTAIAFVQGDVSAVAKALREFSRTYPSLVVKGGLLDGASLSPAQLAALADLPSREVLLAQFAGALSAPLTQLAGLLQALPRNLAYGLSALVEERGGVPAAAVEAGSEPAAGADAEAGGAEPESEAQTEAEPAAAEAQVEAQPEAEAGGEAQPEAAETGPEAQAEVAPDDAATE